MSEPGAVSSKRAQAIAQPFEKFFGLRFASFGDQNPSDAEIGGISCGISKFAHPLIRLARGIIFTFGKLRRGEPFERKPSLIFPEVALGQRPLVECAGLGGISCFKRRCGRAKKRPLLDLAALVLLGDLDKRRLTRRRLLNGFGLGERFGPPRGTPRGHLFPDHDGERQDEGERGNKRD